MSTPSQPAQRRGWQGQTRNTLDNSCMLGAKWWKVGDRLGGIYQRSFETKFGEGFDFLLATPASLTVKVDEFGVCTKDGPGMEKTVKRFAIPALAGFEMALQDLQANGFPGLRFGDRVLIECVEVQTSKEFGFSDMPMFSISVDAR